MNLDDRHALLTYLHTIGVRELPIEGLAVPEVLAREAVVQPHALPTPSPHRPAHSPPAPPELERAAPPPWIQAPPATPVTPPAAPLRPLAPGLSWDELTQAAAACTLCPDLAPRRTQTVFAAGVPHGAPLLVIGEAPGAEEDRLGLPFVGAAGRLLDQWLGAAGIGRERNVLIANILKCRPPGNRDPSPEEAAHCLPYLRRQIELAQPAAILCVGHIAGRTLLGDDGLTLGRMRDKWWTFEGIPMRVSYHPSFLLRSPQFKRQAWHDLLEVCRRLDAMGRIRPPHLN